MREEPALLVAAKLAAELSREIEADITAKHGSRPLLHVLVKMRDDAIRALASLAFAENMEEVREHQADVRMFISAVEKIKIAFASGFEAEFMIAAEDQEEINELVGNTPDEEQPETGQEE